MFEYSLQEIVDFINKCYKDTGIDREEILKFFDNKDMFLDKVYPEVVNTDRYLASFEERNIVHMDYLDLSECYYISLGQGARIKVTQEYIDKLNISHGELMECARNNNYGNMKLRTMSEILSEMMGVDDFPDDDMMYVLTRKDGMFGASYLADYDILWQVCRKLECDKIVILPSSRHELIILKYSDELSANELYDMVSSVNRTEVAEEDFLSDNVYIYDRINHTLDYLS